MRGKVKPRGALGLVPADRGEQWNQYNDQRSGCPRSSGLPGNRLGMATVSRETPAAGVQLGDTPLRAKVIPAIGTARSRVDREGD